MFIRGLRETYEPLNEQQIARDRLANCRQLCSFNDYNHAFTSIIMRIEDISAAKKLDRYVRGLTNAIQTEVLMEQPENLQQAMKIASTFNMKMHAASRLFMPYNNFHNIPQQPRYYDGPTPMETNAIQAYNFPTRSPFFNRYGQHTDQNRPPYQHRQWAPPHPSSLVNVPPRPNASNPNQGQQPTWGRRNELPQRRN